MSKEIFITAVVYDREGESTHILEINGSEEDSWKSISEHIQRHYNVAVIQIILESPRTKL